MRLPLALGLAIGWSIAAAHPAAAGMTGACAFTLNGIEVAQIDSLTSPLELTVDDRLLLSGVDPAATSEATVAVAIGPVVVKSETTAYDPPADSFSATIDLGDVAPYGVGLLRVTATTDGCRADAWLRLSGRFPLTTLTGITAAGLTIAGVTGQLGAVASRRRWSRTAAALGGIATGVGGAALGQQLGLLKPTYLSTAVVVLVASTVGFGLAAVFGPSRREQKPERAPTSPETPERETAAPGSPQAPRVRGVSAAPYWCYVLAETDLLDLDDHGRVIARLRPGVWYLARREAGQWLHVSTGDGTEGWVARESVHRPESGSREPRTEG